MRHTNTSFGNVYGLALKRRRVLVAVRSRLRVAPQVCATTLLERQFLIRFSFCRFYLSWRKRFSNENRIKFVRTNFPSITDRSLSVFVESDQNVDERPSMERRKDEPWSILSTGSSVGNCDSDNISRENRWNEKQRKTTFPNRKFSFFSAYW